MTKDKGFKRVVREQAKESGRRYSAVRADLRPPTFTAPTGEAATAGVDGFRAAFAAIVESVSESLYGQPEVVRLVTIGVVLGQPVLLTARPGAGRTTLAKGVATAIGANAVFVNGGTDVDPIAESTWSAGDLVLVDQFDGMRPAHQAAVMGAARQPAALLCGRSPLSSSAPYPLGDEPRDRFLFDVHIGYGDEATELRVLEAVRAGTHGAAWPVTDLEGVRGMRTTAAAVDVPEDVRRFAVKAVAATRADEALAVGASLLATTSVVQAAAVVAAADGRAVATIEDARSLLRPALSHRIVFRDGAEPDVDAVVQRALSVLGDFEPA